MAYLGNDLQVAFPTYRNIDDISGSFNGVTTSFPLTVAGVAPIPAPINSQQCLISVNGVVQRPDDSGTEGFRLSGGNIIFASAPAGGVDFFGVILAGADYVNIGANFPSGTAVAPSITFDSDLDTGIYNPAGNQIGFTTSGVQRLVINSSGQISGGLGTAAAPVISFISDPNTGIYSPGADQVAISTGGSGRLFVDASGYVSIGTTNNPAAAQLIVTKIGGAQGFEFLPGSSTTVNTILNYDRAGSAYLTSAVNALDHIWQTSGTERLRITSAGLVGIGTSSPANQLHVIGGGLFASSTTAGTLVQARNSDVSSLGYFGVEGSTGGVTLTGTLANATLIASGAAGTSLQFGTGGVIRATLTSTGLGIGTTSPGALLDARGSIRLGNQGSGDGTTAISSSNGVYIGVNHDTTTTTVVPLQIGGYPAAPSYSGTPDHAIVLDGWSGSTIYHNAIVNRKGRELSFHTAITGNGFSDTNERARIDSSGRLLVGTSSTVRDSRLCVRGNASGSFTGDLELGAAAGYASISVDNTIGVLRFTESTNGGIFAQLYAESDGTPGNNDYPGRLVFSTTADGASSPTERMRINNSGDLLYGVTSFTNAVKGFLISGTTGRTYITCNGDTVLDLNRLSNTGEVAAFRTASTQVGSITVTGSATAYNTSSDYRLKENVTAVTDGITRLQQLKPSRFNFIAEPDKTVDGFIAHEVQAVVPEAITGKKDAEDEDGNPIYQGIDQSKLVPLLTAALQEAIGEIESLKARVAALESA